MTTQHSLNDIVDVFIKFMMPRLANVDKFDTLGRSALVEKIIYRKNRNEPLDFVMLGLPFKSTNKRDKVLGIKPDFGEELMMRNFNRFSKAIKEVYEPGIKNYSCL